MSLQKSKNLPARPAGGPAGRQVKKVHFVGIKGVGMTPLAIIAKEAKFEVTGSDVSDTFITDSELSKAGIISFVGFDPKHIEEADLVIYTSAHEGTENPEVRAAASANIPILNQGRALALFQKGEPFGKKFKGISVSGSHGKTTTTALIATVLVKNNLDPSYVIGTSNIPSLGSSGHFGRGQYFITEADEYFADAERDKTPKLLLQNPQIGVITNVDFDHPDIYSSIDEIRKVFVEFTKNITPDGVLIACGDGQENRKFLNEVNVRKITYGISQDNDFILERENNSPDKMFFWVKSKDTLLGQFSMGVFGAQNALNGLCAVVVGLEIGLSVDQIKKALSTFSGTKRRSEFVGNLPGGGLLYDDYAHHPEEIKKTLSAFRKSFPKHKIIPIFQPHMYSRTKKLFKEFSQAFSDCDEVILAEIFPSFREKVDPSFSSSLLASEIKKYGKRAEYFPKPSNVVEYVSSRVFDKNTLLITMGAGDIYKIGNDLIGGGSAR